MQYTDNLEDEEDAVDLTPKSPQTIFEGTTETAIVTVPADDNVSQSILASNAAKSLPGTPKS